MDYRSGVFKCPKCGCQKVFGFDVWQNKGDKWIFQWWGGWASYHKVDANTAYECWKKYGGSTMEKWNSSRRGYGWECDAKCGYKSNNLSDFIVFV